MPKFSSIIDQNKAIGFLAVLLKRGDIPHGLLFSGPAGVGKRDAAVAFAMAVNCRKRETIPDIREGLSNAGGQRGNFSVEPCGECRSCKKIDSGSHPDIISIEPQGVFIKIAQVRQLRHTLSMRPHEARARFVIIGDSHAMNPEAGNALLKVLEEPPERTNLILTATQLSDLLPTIVSRCQHIRFHPVSSRRLAEVLVLNHHLSSERALVLSTLAYGSYVRAMALMDTDWERRREWILDEIRFAGTSPVSVMLALAEKLSQKKDAIGDTLEIIKTWMRDLIVVKYSPDKIINKDYGEELYEASQKMTMQTILHRISAISRAQRALDANVNPRLILENLFLLMADSN